MAREPQARAPQASAEDDFYGAEGAQEDDRRQGREEGAGETEDDAALDLGEEQEVGDEEDLGADDDFDDEPPRETRGGKRISVLANELRDTRRQLDDLRRQPATQPAGPREETDAEFEARIAQLLPEERMEARYQRDRAFQQRRDQSRDFQTANDRDRSSYETKARANRFMARLQDRVEREFNDRLRRGQPVSRIDLYYWLRGQMADKTSVKDTTTARQQARERLDRNTVKPGRSGASDVEAPRGRRGQLSEREQRARRLENVQI